MGSALASLAGGGHNGGLPDAPSPPSPNIRETDTPRSNPERNFLERAKELDFEHRSHERSVARVTLSLSVLRRAWHRRWTRTQPAIAAAVPRPPEGTLAITFVGHATVMLTTPGARLLTDPMLEDSLCGLRRVRSAAIDAADLSDLDLVLISSAHRDHLSRKTLARLPREAMVLTPPRCGELIANLGFRRVVELPVGQTFPFGDVEITSVPTHQSGLSGARGGLGGRGRGASGYIVRTPKRVVYFAGDTGYFSGFADVGGRFRPDVALLPIARYQPAPFRREHLSPLDAVYALQDLGARILVPTSYGSFELAYEPVDEPLAWLRALDAEGRIPGSLTILEHGQTCLVR